jgi:hypothetical protein
MLQPLLLTGFGGLLAILGTIAGYILQTREARSVRAGAYGREDRFRLHQDRREAYRAFHLAFGEARDVIELYMESRDDIALLKKVQDAREEAWRKHLTVWHIGAVEVVQAARKIMGELTDIGWNGATSDNERWIVLIGSYVLAVRNDLLGEKSSYQEAEAAKILPVASHRYPIADQHLPPLPSIRIRPKPKKAKRVTRSGENVRA